MKQRRQYIPKGQLQRLTKAVTHIRLLEVNPGKLASLDALAPVYLALCQQYVTFFCQEEPPDRVYEFVVGNQAQRWVRDCQKSS